MAATCQTCGTFLIRSRVHTPEACTSARLSKELRACGWYVTPRRHFARFERGGLCVAYPTGARGALQRWSPRAAIDACDENPSTDLAPWHKFPLPSSFQKKSA